MLRKIEKNAKNKEEALKLAAEEFGVPVEELSYEVEREVGKGLMGLLIGKEVIISAWITKEAEEEERIQKLAQSRAASDKTTGGGANPYAPKEVPSFKDHVGPEGRKKKASAPLKKAETPATPEPESAPKKAPKRSEVTEQSLKDADFFLNELIHKMGLADAEITVVHGGDSVDATVAGSKMGALIGKRGETLDAVQYLTSLYVNKEKHSYIKVNVDTEGYRAKREETLKKLAKSLEYRVVRERKAVSLEPMSPNERRIIHAALQNSTRVKTYSVGEEPRRKVTVAPIDEA
ncbi:MAG: KH domain-containing protein [Clostridia bacterium]|nr:KH domain-containing protein [Clostridia bacterium]